MKHEKIWALNHVGMLHHLNGFFKEQILRTVLINVGNLL